MTWLILTPLLLVSPVSIQSQPPTRQRQDRRAALPAAAAEPIPEVYVAAGNLTTVAFNGPLDRDSLVVDRTRFKWVDVGDRILALQPVMDLGSGERLMVKIGFKDRSLPTQAVLAVVTDSAVMDGNVEVDRRANTPEALLAALTQKEAELEELKARYAGGGPAGLVLSEWLDRNVVPAPFEVAVPPADASGLSVTESIGYAGSFSALVAIRIRNLPGQTAWAVRQARITGWSGTPVKVLSVQMKPVQLAPGEMGLVAMEVQAPPWAEGKPFSVEFTDTLGQRRASFNLLHK